MTHPPLRIEPPRRAATHAQLSATQPAPHACIAKPAPSAADIAFDPARVLAKVHFRNKPRDIAGGEPGCKGQVDSTY